MITAYIYINSPYCWSKNNKQYSISSGLLIAALQIGLTEKERGGVTNTFTQHLVTICRCWA